VFSVQAIVLSTRVAHNLGQSEPLANLVTSAIGIAQTMGLHKIRAKPKDSGDMPSGSRLAWFESVEIEVGKRTWWQLVIQDHFSIPFTETYGEYYRPKPGPRSDGRSPPPRPVLDRRAVQL